MKMMMKRLIDLAVEVYQLCNLLVTTQTIAIKRYARLNGGLDGKRGGITVRFF